MAGLSFIDIVFPQFSGNHWQGGVSLFRSGSVGKLSFYGELVSARVRAGIGENYDVRLKLHSQGKGVQWMECTCQANRRKGEKCSHIAALCLLLDQENAPSLEKFGLSGHGADKHLFKKESTFENILLAEAQGTSSDSSSAASKAGGDASRGLGIILTEGKAKIVDSVWNEDEFSLQLTVDYGPKKLLTYSLGIDDALRILNSSEVKGQIPKKTLSVLNNTLVAERFFECRKHGTAGIQIVRLVLIRDSIGRVRGLGRIRSVGSRPN